MAVGDAFVHTSVASVAAGGTVDIRPASGYEAKLHYVLHSGNGKVEITDGTNVVVAGSAAAGNCVFGQAITLTNGQYAKFTSLEASAAQTFTFVGVYSKVPA